MIYENELVDLTKSPHEFVYDFEEALIQYKRPFYKPLVTDNFQKVSLFSSWRGRTFCLLYSGKLIFREVYRTAKHVLTLILNVSLLALNLLNFLCTEEAKENLSRKAAITIGFAMNFAIRPIGFSFDFMRLVLGCLIHPKLAIATIK